MRLLDDLMTLARASDTGNRWEGGVALDAIKEITELRGALGECLERMKELNEPCDHSVGICWCDFHRAMDRASAAISKATAAS